jgi:hypothetical protein
MGKTVQRIYQIQQALTRTISPPRNFKVDINAPHPVNNRIPDSKKPATDAGLKRL